MKIIEGELARIRAEIARLKVQEEAIASILAKVRSEPPPTAMPRKRSPAIQPLVIDVMREVGFTGAKTAEVDKIVRQKVPSVAKDTVGSILSRLKADGALTYDGDRYYLKEYTPKPTSPFERDLRVVS